MRFRIFLSDGCVILQLMFQVAEHLGQIDAGTRIEARRCGPGSKRPDFSRLISE